jgi:hypothetical protein
VAVVSASASSSRSAIDDDDGGGSSGAPQRPAANSYRTPTKVSVVAAVVSPSAQHSVEQHSAEQRPSMQWKDADGTDDWAVDRVNEDWINKVVACM